MQDVQETIAWAQRAPAEDQEEVLWLAIDRAHTNGFITADQRAFAVQCISIGAYESAAMALVSSGCGWNVGSVATAQVYGPRDKLKDQYAGGATPALALAAAAMQAQMAMQAEEATK